MPDVYVYVIPFPVPECKEMVCLNADGSYTMYINAELSRDQQEAAYRHGLKHIRNDDFYNGKSVQEIEWEAHYG